MTTERERFEEWAKTQTWPHYWHNGGGMVFNDSSFEAWQAALSAPPGYVLVPVEPTPEMVTAMIAAMNVWIKDIGEDADIYAAMIAAAPKEPT